MLKPFSEYVALQETSDNIDHLITSATQDIIAAVSDFLKTNIPTASHVSPPQNTMKSKLSSWLRNNVNSPQSQVHNSTQSQTPSPFTFQHFMKEAIGLNEDISNFEPLRQKISSILTDLTNKVSSFRPTQYPQKLELPTADDVLVQLRNHINDPISFFDGLNSKEIKLLLARVRGALKGSNPALVGTWINKLKQGKITKSFAEFLRNYKVA